MDRKVRSLCFGFLVLLLWFDVHLISWTEARPLKLWNLDKSVEKEETNSRGRMSSVWTMKYSGPSRGGKGHRSNTGDTPILKHLKDSGIGR